MKMKTRNNHIVHFLLVTAIIALAAAFSGSAADKANDIGLTYEIDKPEARIGDRINLKVTASRKKGMDIIFPQELEDPGEFNFIGSSPVKSGFGPSERNGMAYVLSIYTTGTHVIPPVTVRYKKEKDAEWNAVESPQVPIEIKSLLTGDDKDIRGIKGLVSLGMSKRTLVMIFLILLAAGAVGLAVWIRKKYLRTLEEAARNKTADEIAYEELRALKAMDLPGKGLIKEYYVRLSDIARRYLEKRFSLRAPEMTTEEFLDTLRASSLLEAEHKNLLREFLSHCDLVKFAKYGPTPIEMIDSFKSAEKLVDQTREIKEEEPQ